GQSQLPRPNRDLGSRRKDGRCLRPGQGQGGKARLTAGGGRSLSFGADGLGETETRSSAQRNLAPGSACAGDFERDGATARFAGGNPATSGRASNFFRALGGIDAL